MKAMKGGVVTIAYKAVYAELSGGAATGLLLSQIAYWCLPKKGKFKLRVQREDKNWLAKTAEEMQLETGISEHQYRKGMARLKDLGLIETKVFKFNGRPATHIWLDAGKLEQLVSLENFKALQPKVKKEKSVGGTKKITKSICTPCQNPSGHIVQIHSDTSTNLYTEITSENTTETTLTPLAWVEKAKAPDTDWVVENPEMEEKKNPTLHFPTEWWHMKATDVLARRKEGKLSTQDLQKGVNGCVMLWKRLMATEFGGFQKAFTLADAAKMKQLCVACEEKAPELISLVVQDWGGLVWRVKCDKGLSQAPDRPHIGFLLKYHDVGMNMLDAKLQSIAKAIAAAIATPAPVVQPQPQIQQEPQKPKAVGFKAMLAEMKEQQVKQAADLAKGPNAPVSMDVVLAELQKGKG